MLFLPWCHADRTQGLLRGDSEHRDQGSRVQAAPQQVFPCNISSLQATVLRFSKVAKAEGVNTNPTSGPPGDCRVSRGPSPLSPTHETMALERAMPTDTSFSVCDWPLPTLW